MAVLRSVATVLRHAVISMDLNFVDTGQPVRLRVFPSRATVFPSMRISVLTPVLTSTVNHAGAHLDTCRFAAYLSAYFTHYCFVLGRLGQWGSWGNYPQYVGATCYSAVNTRSDSDLLMPLASRVPDSFTPRLWLELVKLLPVGYRVL